MLRRCLCCRNRSRTHLLLFLITSVVILLLRRLGLLSSDTARSSFTEGRGERKVNVLLGVKTDDERWNVDDLLADTALIY